jgi:hypothetical protein
MTTTTRAWIVEPPPPIRCEPQIYTENGVEQRRYIIRLQGAEIAATPYAWAATRIADALRTYKGSAPR